MTAKRQNKETGPEYSMDPSAEPRPEILPVTSAVPDMEPRRGHSRFVPGFRFRFADLIILVLILALAGVLYYGISVTAAQTAIDQMVAAEVLALANANRRNRVWVAREVLDALDEFAKRAGRRRLPGQRSH